MEPIKIVNNTVYDSADVLKLVQTALKHRRRSYYGSMSPGDRVLKIRYLNGLRNGRHAHFVTGSVYGCDKPLEIAIIRPAKIEVNALMWLAGAADGDADTLTVPPQVLKDIVAAVVGSSWDTKDRLPKALAEVEELGLSLQMHNKAKGKKKYTIQNIREKINSKRNSLKLAHGKKEIAEYQIRLRTEEIKRLGEELTKLEAKLAKKEAEYAKKKEAK